MASRGRAESDTTGTVTNRRVQPEQELPPVFNAKFLSVRFPGVLTEKVLENLRRNGGGPRFRRRGHPTRGRVIYLREDVLSWLQNLPTATTTLEERLRVERTAA